jgi:hypothetical protein
MQTQTDYRDYRWGVLAGVLVLACSLWSYFAGQRSIVPADGCPICDCSRAVVALPGAVSAVSQ